MKDLPVGNQLEYVSWDSEYYVRKDFYRLKSDDYLRRLRTPDFDLKYTVNNMAPWTYCSVIGKREPVQGWKIHVSGTYDNHFAILKKVFNYCVEHELDFKFVINIENFISINGRESSRSQHGKSIVIYPCQETVKETLEDLYKLLKGYDGPYILSDRPYKDSKVIYYRYGEIEPIYIANEYGTMDHKIYGKNKELISDTRNPYFKLPEGTDDPFEHKKNGKKSIFLSKYNVEKVLHFSSQGGVYEVSDKEGNIYIAKEARAYAAVDGRGKYGTDRIKREYCILKALDGEYTPKAIELIEDCGNVYLIEEKVKGTSLEGYGIKHSPIVYYEQREKFDEDYKAIVTGTLKGMHYLEEKGMVIGDVSGGNVMYDSVSKEIRFIDLETVGPAYDVDNDEVFITPGYTAINPVDKLHADLQKMAIVLLSCIYQYTSMFYRFPNKVFDCIESLMEEETIEPKYLMLYREIFKGRITRADEALKYLKRPREKKKDSKVEFKDSEALYKGLLKTLKSDYADYNNHKTYNIPCDPAGYVTNTYCLGYGSAGVMYALSCIGQKELVKDSVNVVQELVKGVYEGRVNSQGLYVGKTGIAVSLLNAGEVEHAKFIFNLIDINHMSMFDVSYGIAGVMMADIEFYMKTGEPRYKKQFYDCVIKLKDGDPKGIHKWPDAEGDYYHGFTRGPAGIALALLEGGILFEDDEIKKYAKAILDDELKIVEYKEGGRFKGISSWPENREPKVFSPYMHAGACGLGAVVLRFSLYYQDETYLRIIRDIANYINKTRPVFPGWLRGMTGIVSFIDDCIYYLNYEDLISLREYYYKLISLYRVGTDNDRLLGDEFAAASDDLFTGSAGLLMELHRARVNDKVNWFIMGDRVFA